MPIQTPPPFIPDEFDLRSILESGLGQVALPVLLGGAGVTQTGGRIGQGVASGLKLALELDAARRAQQGNTALGGVIRSGGLPQFPGATTGTPATTATSPSVPTVAPQGGVAPTILTSPGLPPTSPQSPAVTPPAVTSPAIPAVSSPPAVPTAGAPPGAPGAPGAPGQSSNPQQQLQELVAIMMESGNIPGAAEFLKIFTPPTARPLDPHTVGVRKAQQRNLDARTANVGKPKPETEAEKSLKRARERAANAVADLRTKQTEDVGRPRPRLPEELDVLEARANLLDLQAAQALQRSRLLQAQERRTRTLGTTTGGPALEVSRLANTLETITFSARIETDPSKKLELLKAKDRAIRQLNRALDAMGASGGVDDPLGFGLGPDLGTGLDSEVERDLEAIFNGP